MRRARWKRKPLLYDEGAFSYFRKCLREARAQSGRIFRPKPREPDDSESGKTCVDQLLFPRSPLRSALPGRKRERQRKEKQRQCDKHPESGTQLTTAGMHFPVLKRYSAPQYNLPVYHRTDYNDQKRLFFWTGTARFLFGKTKRKWGVQFPPPPRCGQERKLS